MFNPILSLLLISCRSEDGIKAYNSQPAATITSHSTGSELRDGYEVTLIGQVSDANHSNGELLVTWATNSGELCTDSTPSDSGESICTAIFTENDSEIRMQVVDPEGAAGVETISISVLPTQNPQAEITSPLPSGVYYSDQKITFEGVITDEEDDATDLVATWESDLDGVLSSVEATPDNSGSILGFGYLTQGEHAVTLLVEDTTGKTDTASVIIQVGPPNSAPSCGITAPVSGSAGPENETVDFMASVSDVDIASDLLTVSWTSDKDGTMGESTPTSAGNVLFSFADLSVNTHTITMTVTDEIGSTCTDLVSYTVGTPPQVTLDSPTNGDIYDEGTSILFSASVSDIQDQPDDIALTWEVDGSVVSTQGATSSGTATWFDSTIPAGSHTLVVTATDSDGLTNSTQATFTVNGIPSSPQISITPNPATTSQQLTANIDVASIDPEGATITYQYEWYKNNVLETSQTSPIIAANDTSKGDIWMVHVIPSDGITTGEHAEAQITISNTPPSISSTAITPSGNVYNDDVLTCTTTVTDPDETLNPSYSWSVNGSVVGSGGTLDLDSVGAMPNDLVVCSASAMDDEGVSVEEQASVTILNRAPTLTGTSISPSAGITTSSLVTCSSTVFDADGESLTPVYSWSVGSNTYSGSSLQLDASMTTPGDTITCMVEVADGYGGTANDSVSSTVSNSLPVVDSITFDASSYQTNDSITATAVVSDGDASQSLSAAFEWHIVDASDASTDKIVQSGSSPILDGSLHFDRDDEVYVIVTPNDGVNDGAPVTSGSVIIDNTAPSSPTLSISPDPATAGQDDLTCSVDTPSTDDDGDSVVYTYEWTDESGTVQQTTTETSSTNDTFLGAGTTEGTWTCSVMPTDLTDTGAAATQTVSVESSLPMADLFLWLDASQGTSCSSDGCTVSQWDDLSGNQHHATQGNGSLQPIYRAAGFQGLPSLEFKGRYLELSSLSLFQTSSSGLSVFVVFSTENSTGQKFLLNHGPTSCHCSCTFELGYSTGNNTAGNFGLHRGCGHAIVSSGGTIPNNTPLLMSTIISSSGNSPHNMDLYKNGTLISTQNNNAGWNSAGGYSTASSPMQIGIRNDYQTGNYESQHQGQIAEILIYSSDLSESTRRQVECHLSSKYSLGVQGCTN